MWIDSGKTGLMIFQAIKKQYMRNIALHLIVEIL